MTKSGEHQVRSMVYTEYFASGTEPWDTCRLHEGGGFFQRDGRALRRRQGAAAGADRDDRPAGQGSEPAAGAGAAPRPRPPPTADAGAPEPEKKKRGFWSRVFGKRDKDEKKPRLRPDRGSRLQAAPAR